MRKIIVSNLVTQDGFFSGPNGELDWHMIDEEFDAYAAQQLSAMDAILFGRVTYEMMASYWPTPAAMFDDSHVAEQMNSLPKIVVSTTLTRAAWGSWDNVSLIHDHVADHVAELKQQPGRDMVIFGSGALVSFLALHDLIDEYRLITHPIVLGQGQPMFRNLTRPIELKLLGVRLFRSGKVLSCYRQVTHTEHSFAVNGYHAKERML